MKYMFYNFTENSTLGRRSLQTNVYYTRRLRENQSAKNKVSFAYASHNSYLQSIILLYNILLQLLFSFCYFRPIYHQSN